MDEPVKKKWPDNSKYKYKSTVTLNVREADAIKEVLKNHNCRNISELCRKIVRRELVLTLGDPANYVYFEDGRVLRRIRREQNEMLMKVKKD